MSKNFDAKILHFVSYRCYFKETFVTFASTIIISDYEHRIRLEQLVVWLHPNRL